MSFRTVFQSQPETCNCSGYECVYGLNLQAGGHILIWYSMIWNLELYQQTNSRLWRQGQMERVSIHHIVTADTMDEDVMEALRQKNMTQEKLMPAVRARVR